MEQNDVYEGRRKEEELREIFIKIIHVTSRDVCKPLYSRSTIIQPIRSQRKRKRTLSATNLRHTSARWTTVMTSF